MNAPRHVLVIGSGSNAGYLLGLLSNKSGPSGFRVTALATESEAAALRQFGLRIEGKDSILRCRPQVIVDPLDASDEVDLVVLATRGEQARIAFRGLGRVIERGAAVLAISAGVPWWLPAANGALRGAAIEAPDPDGKVLASIPINCIVAGIIDVVCDRPLPNLVRHYSGQTLTIGSASPSLALLCEIQRLLSDARLECAIAPDIQSMIWSKLIVSGPVDAMSILTRTTPAEIAASRAGRLVLIRAMGEIECVGTALGLGPFGITGDRLAAHIESRSSKTSFLHETERGLDLELDTTIASIIEIGHRTGIGTPTLELLRDAAQFKASAYLRR